MLSFVLQRFFASLCNLFRGWGDVFVPFYANNQIREFLVILLFLSLCLDTLQKSQVFRVQRNLTRSQQQSMVHFVDFANENW